MITRGSILSGAMVVGSYHEAIGPFTGLFSTDIFLIWDKMVLIIQGTDEWTYLNPSNKHHGRMLGYKLIYKHYIGPNNIDHMADVTETNSDQCTS